MAKNSPVKVRGVFERPSSSGCWWIQYFDAEGKRHREKVGSKGAAIKLVELRRTQRLEGRKLPKPRTRPLLFRELTEAALAYSRGRAGYAANISRMKGLVAEFGNSVAQEIAPERIEAWLDTRSEWTIATRNRYIALLKLVYRLAEKARRIDRNAARFLRQAKENNARIRYLTDKEELDLRSVIQRKYPNHMPEFEVALHTGMRSSEQYGMEWSNVDFEAGVITVPRSKHGEKRYVHMNSRVKAILAAAKARSLGTGRVFSCQNARHWFEPSVVDAAIRGFLWHDLRHTFVSRLVMSGADLRTVQDLAGHKTIQMTMRYAHLAPSHLQAAIERLVPSATSTATAEIETAKADQASIH